MDITSAVKSTTDERHENSKESSAGTSNDNCLQNNCKDMLNLKVKFVGEEEHNIVVGRCFRHGQRNCIVYKGLDTNTGNLVAVIKWIYLHRNLKKKKIQKNSEANYLKQIKVIEEEFKNLRHINLNNVVNYLGMQHSLKNDKIIVYVLQELVCGMPLLQIFRNIPVTIPSVQFCAKEILMTLHSLHKNGIVHQNLRLSNVFIDSFGSIKLADYCLDKKLHALSTALPKDVAKLCLSLNAKCNSKDDIYNFGILILTLFVGPLKNENPVIIPDSVNPVMKDFLNKCFISDEKLRWSAEQLLSHPFLCIHANDIDLAKTKVSNENRHDYLENSLGYYSNHSRLNTEFNILRSLGKGGFAQVFKVQNKLDSREYALKKIPLDPKNKQLNIKIKREVTLLSRLSHENIVRYYNSWIETTPDSHCLQDVSVSGESKTESKDGFSQYCSSISWEMKNCQLLSEEEDSDNSSDSVIFVNEKDSDNNNDSIIFMNEKESSDKTSEVSHTKRNVSPNLQSVSNNGSSIRMKQYMYIQMEFCENSTLRTAIDTGLYKNKVRLLRLFREIAEGLHYIHQQGVIHRDLKPVNIFLNANDSIKIGDFGLATDNIPKIVAAEATSNELKKESYPDGFYLCQTGEVGTAFYVAPELACSGRVQYDQKVDMYSLGIIFFEMCFPMFGTAMERCKILTNLRKEEIIFPNDAYGVLSGEMVQLLIFLLQHDATKRLSSADLLSSKFMSRPSIVESENISVSLPLD